VVTKANLQEYADLILEKRAAESEIQMKAVKEGVYFVIPLEMLKLLTWEELEIRACGDKIIEVEKLKKITTYSGGSESDEAIQRFWRVFEEFTEDEKQQYLKFVWGRSRLPYETKGMRGQTISLIKTWGDS